MNIDMVNLELKREAAALDYYHIRYLEYMSCTGAYNRPKLIKVF
jgi:hypothetical protein